MRRTNEKERVLGRMLAEELKRVEGGRNPVCATMGPSGKKDITDANNGDCPQV